MLLAAPVGSHKDGIPTFSWKKTNAFVRLGHIQGKGSPPYNKNADTGELNLLHDAAQQVCVRNSVVAHQPRIGPFLFYKAQLTSGTPNRAFGSASPPGNHSANPASMSAWTRRIRHSGSSDADDQVRHARTTPNMAATLHWTPNTGGWNRHASLQYLRKVSASQSLKHQTSKQGAPNVKREGLALRNSATPAAHCHLLSFRKDSCNSCSRPA